MMTSEWHFSRHFGSGWSDEKNEIFQFFRRRIHGKKNDGSMYCGNFSSPNDGRTSVGRRHLEIWQYEERQQDSSEWSYVHDDGHHETTNGTGSGSVPQSSASSWV